MQVGFPLLKHKSSFLRHTLYILSLGASTWPVAEVIFHRPQARQALQFLQFHSKWETWDLVFRKRLKERQADVVQLTLNSCLWCSNLRSPFLTTQSPPNPTFKVVLPSAPASLPRAPSPWNLCYGSYAFVQISHRIMVLYFKTFAPVCDCTFRSLMISCSSIFSIEI